MHLRSNINFYVKYFGTQLLGGPLPLGLTRGRGPLYTVYPVYPIVTPLSRVNCSSQVCWRRVNLQGLWLQKEEEDDEFDECLGCENDKIWIELI